MNVFVSLDRIDNSSSQDADCQSMVHFYCACRIVQVTVRFAVIINKYKIYALKYEGCIKERDAVKRERILK